MTRIQRLLRFIVLPIVGSCLVASVARGADADSSSLVPPVIQAGFAVWPRDGAAPALDVWQKGGLVEGDRKVGAEVSYFKRMAPAIGAYKNYELLQAQRVSQSSQVLYLSINFERAVIYARFLLYKTEQDWVVQNMDFNAKPEVVVPWMALPGMTGTE